MPPTIEEQRQLPLRKALRLAWKNLRVRWWRSLLVTSGVVLAVAFLMYVLESDQLTRSALLLDDPGINRALEERGLLGTVAESDLIIQARWMVGLALLISFVGILNAMVLSVTERFREIGTMKCLGALDSLVIRIYLLESLFHGLGGACVGAVVGGMLALIEAATCYGSGLGLVFEPVPFVKALLVCTLTGVALSLAAAAYPAWLAARMKPVDAMSTEV